MAIVRRRILSIAPVPSRPSPSAPPPLQAPDASPLPPPDRPAPEASALPEGRLRRCTFRRIDRVDALPGRAASANFEAMCLYVDDERPLSLGTIEDARPVCDACQATGIFRPDED